MNSVSVKFLFDFGSPNAYLCPAPPVVRCHMTAACVLFRTPSRRHDRRRGFAARARTGMKRACVRAALHA